MKRLNGIWPDVVDLENGIRAIIEGTRFKRGQHEVQWLLYSPEEVAKDKTLWHRINRAKAQEYAARLCKELEDGEWRHKLPRYRRQYCRNRASSRGKWRDLYIPTLDDHVVGHMVMNASMDAFMRGMHPYSCGSIPGRGIKHVNHNVRKWMRFDKECRYFVKLDIRHFFDNIDRDRLMGVLESKIKDRNVLWVFQQIVDSAPVPCPVGYYTSPWLANLYLEKLDWFVEQQLYKERRGKRIKYVRHYLRYVDDILLIGTSKNDMKKAIRGIQTFLRNKRGLEIKGSWEIKAIGKHEIIDGKWKMRPSTYWCDIGGYKFCKDATVMRDGIYIATKRMAHKMAKQKRYTPHQSSSLNARLGWASHCNSKNFIRQNIKPFVNIQAMRRAISNVDKDREQQRNYTSRT